MRQQFIGTDLDAERTLSATQTGAFIDCDGDEHIGTPGLVADVCPWVAVTVEVEGGYHAFESADDAKIWLAQK